MSDPQWFDGASRSSRGTVIFFLLIILGVPAVEIGHGVWPGSNLEAAPDLEEIREGKAARRVAEDLERHSAVADRVRPFYNEIMLAVFHVATPKVTVGRDGWLFLTETVRKYPDPDMLRKLPETIALLSRMVEWFAARGTNVLILVVPNKATLHPDKLALFGPHPKERVYPRIMELLRRAGLWSLDLEPVLGGRKDDAHYYANDTHWTGLGALRAAEAVGKGIAERFDGRLAGNPSAARVEILPPEPHEGDLLRMLDLPPEGPTYKRLLRSYPKVTVTGGSGGSATGTVVLAGTSFSKSLEFAALLETVLKVEVEDRSRLGGGPTGALLEVANRIFFAEREPPSLLIWELPERHLFNVPFHLQLPLKEFLKGHGFDADSARPLPSTRRRAENLRIEEEADGSLRGIPLTPDPILIYELEHSLPGDGSVAVSYLVEPEAPTTTHVYFDIGTGFKHALSAGRSIREKGHSRAVVIPIKTPDGSPVVRLRIDPVNRLVPFRMGPVRLLGR